jgi:hypothetical protein
VQEFSDRVRCVEAEQRLIDRLRRIEPAERLVIARFGLWDEEYLQTEEDLVKMIGELIADVLVATRP